MQWEVSQDKVHGPPIHELNSCTHSTQTAGEKSKRADYAYILHLQINNHHIKINTNEGS